MIEIQNASFGYANGHTDGQLRNINLSVPDGQVVLVCGESGCGKTTLIRLVNGLVPKYYEGNLQGEVFIGGKSISEIPLYDTAPLIGSVFQNPKSQFFSVNTTDELAFACENLGLPESEIIERIERVVREFQIESLMDRSLFALSGGEKQKIACASTAVLAPKVFALDEPSSNLDVRSIRELARVIALWKRQGKTILIAEHRLSYLMGVVDRIIYMQNGEIVRDIPLQTFKSLTPEEISNMGLRSRSPVSFCLNRQPATPNDGISISDFDFHYVRQTVLRIDKLHVPKGSIVAVLGNNGAGKTTFARCLCGLQKQAAGKLVMDGKLYTAKQRLNICYMVMQDVNHQLFTESVLDEVLLSMEGDEEQNRSAAEQILSALNLRDYMDRHPMSLSGGQKQRVAIASALASARDLIVFDEPTSGLDYRHMGEVANNLKKLSELGKTLFVITHDPELVNRCCNYFVFIERGEVTLSGDWNNIIQKKISEFFGQAAATP